MGGVLSHDCHVTMVGADAEQQSKERQGEDGQPLVARWTKPSNPEGHTIGSDSEGEEVVYSYNAN